MLASAGFLLLIMVLTDIFYADEMLTNKNTGGKEIFFFLVGFLQERSLR